MNYLHSTHKKRTQQSVLNRTSMPHPDRSRCGLGSVTTQCPFPECLSRFNYTPRKLMPSA